MNRRRFLTQAATATGIAAVSGWASLAPPDWPGSLADPDGERGKPRPEEFTLPSGGFTVVPDPLAAALGIARGEDVNALVRGAVDAIGGIARFVARGDIVVIKPNVAFERAAALGATTNPDSNERRRPAEERIMRDTTAQ